METNTFNVDNLVINNTVLHYVCMYECGIMSEYIKNYASK